MTSAHPNEDFTDTMMQQIRIHGSITHCFNNLYFHSFNALNVVFLGCGAYFFGIKGAAVVAAAQLANNEVFKRKHLDRAANARAGIINRKWSEFKSWPRFNHLMRHMEIMEEKGQYMTPLPLMEFPKSIRNDIVKTAISVALRNNPIYDVAHAAYNKLQRLTLRR